MDSDKTATVVNTLAPEDEKGSASILKTDGTNPVAGAVLKLTTTSGVTIDTWTSTTTPHVISNLLIGTYYVEEITPPDGFMKTSKKAIEIVKNQIENVKFVNTPDRKSVV